MPLATLSVSITPNGISAPSYADILLSLQQSMQAIYGADIYITPDSQDGQLLALIAAAINDANNAAIAAFNSFSPAVAQGTALSSLVKINGIKRNSSSFSTAVGNVVGQSESVINNGIVRDQNGNLWNLPASVTIPGGGSIAVTVTAQKPGAIVAPSGTINQIYTPAFGWQSFTSTSDAVIGLPVESDAALRIRQAVSTQLPSLTPLGALFSALANLTGVTALRIYENVTSSTDSNGLPAHSISVVIQGGTLAAIAQIIGQRKTPGAGTYGSTAQSYVDPTTGITYTINFYVLATQDIKVVVTGTALTGYNSNVAIEIQNAVAAYINGLGIGQPVQFSRMYAPAYLNGAADSATYEITGLTIQAPPGAAGIVDLAIPFNKAAVCVAATDVTVTIS